MNPSTSGPLAGIYLHPHQVQFISEFFKEGSPPHQLLISPVGFGRTGMAIALVAQFARKHPAARILILAPHMMLLEQFQHRLVRDYKSPNAEIVNHQRFRELEAQVPIGTEPWGSSLVALLSFRAASQQNILQSVSSTNWDLIIVDEFHQLGARLSSSMEQMLDAGKIQRLLALTTIDHQAQQSLASRLYRTAWSIDLLPPPLRIHLVDYRRGNDESSFLEELRKFLSQQKQDMSSLITMTAASSSSFALERVLRRMRDRFYHPPVLKSQEQEYNDLLLHAGAVSVDEKVSDNILSAGATTHSAEILKSTTQLLERLDSVASDEKLSALLTKLKSLTTSTQASQCICILTAFVATTSYLHSVLTDAGWMAYVLNGNVPSDVRTEALKSFQTEGGILIATQSIMQGVELRDINAVFVYDLPNNETALYLLLARIRAYGRPRPVDVFIFRDQANALPWEGELLTRYRLE